MPLRRSLGQREHRCAGTPSETEEAASGAVRAGACSLGRFASRKGGISVGMQAAQWALPNALAAAAAAAPAFCALQVPPGAPGPAEDPSLRSGGALHHREARTVT